MFVISKIRNSDISYEKFFFLGFCEIMLRNYVIFAYITKFCDFALLCEIKKIIVPELLYNILHIK